MDSDISIVYIFMCHKGLYFFFNHLNMEKAFLVYEPEVKVVIS